jgi:hypothetical protein
MLLNVMPLAAQDALPEPTWVIPFDGSLDPTVAAGAKEHPHLERQGIRFVDGRNGKAALIGDGPILIYQVHGNIPDQATMSFWIKPIDWQPNDEWRYVAMLCLGGRQGMMFANYPKRKQATMQFQWSNHIGPGHEATPDALKPDEWNHVAIAWDGARSRVYFNGNLTLTKEHPAGWHPQINERATIHFGGISLESGSQRSFARNPWGIADTAIDDFVVYPGALDAMQIAALAGVEKQTRPFTGPPPQPHQLNIPKRSNAPTLNGQLDDGEWDESLTLPVLIDARNPGQSFDYPPQRFHYAYDNDNLYVAMRANFPMNAEIKQAPPRASLDAPDVGIWMTESFEFWLAKPGDGRTWRFAASPGGGFAESYAKDANWNGQWTVTSSLNTSIYGNEYWDMELAIPWTTLGVDDPDNQAMRMNFCRTMLFGEELGTASLAGSPNYPLVEHFANVRFDPNGVACAIATTGSPSLGQMSNELTVNNTGSQPLRGNLSLNLIASMADSDRTVQSAAIDLAPGEQRTITVPLNVTDPMFQRVEYRLDVDGADEPLIRYSVPFELRSDFVDLVPLNLQHKLVIKPATTLYVNQLKANGFEPAKVVVRLFDPAGAIVHEQAIEGDEDVWLDLSPDGPWGDYRVRMVAINTAGESADPSEAQFHRPPTPDWATRPDDHLDRVLPPFEPVTVDGTTLGAWGRAYRYGDAMLPTSVAAGGAKELLAAPMTILVDGDALTNQSIAIDASSDVRVDATTTGSNDKLDVAGSFWFEYDGMSYHTLELTAKQRVREVVLQIPFKPEHAQYTHITGGVMSIGGGFTAPIDQSISYTYLPVVWVGDFERGLCWFTETRGDLHTARSDLYHFDVRDDATTFQVHVAENLKAGQKVTIRFGLLATPVKPLHPRHPLNTFIYSAPLHQQVPATDMNFSHVFWSFHKWFLDIPYWDPSTRAMARPDEQLRQRQAQFAPAKLIPYLDPYTLTDEYSAARHYLREWESLPAQHRPPSERRVGPDETRTYRELWMSPASESFRKYFAYRAADLIQRAELEGLYFDFGTALPDANIYHGANGGYPILALRDFYRRLVSEFVKAGVDDYVIIAHNSKSVQIPGLTFVTHFYNGEHHRQKSSDTLHEGRDYLDRIPLYYYGIEQSSLPWGIHGNMLVEFPEARHLINAIGAPNETVSDYLWNRTPSVMMPIMLHGTLPASGRTSHHYYKHVVSVLERFDIPTATFHPYWRNSDVVQVSNDDFKVSVYSRPESPRLLLVVGNLSDEPAETTIRLDLEDFFDWNSSIHTGMRRVEAKGELHQVIEHIGFYDAQLLDVTEHEIRVRVRGHGMALIEVAGNEQVR